MYVPEASKSRLILDGGGGRGDMGMGHRHPPRPLTYIHLPTLSLPRAYLHTDIPLYIHACVPRLARLDAALHVCVPVCTLGPAQYLLVWATKSVAALNGCECDVGSRLRRTGRTLRCLRGRPPAHGTANPTTEIDPFIQSLPSERWPPARDAIGWRL